MFRWALLLLLPLALCQDCVDVELQRLPECEGEAEPDIRFNDDSGCEEWFCNHIDDYGDYGGEECEDPPSPPLDCPPEALLERFDETSGCQDGWECLDVPGQECNDAVEPSETTDCLFEPIVDDVGCISRWNCVLKATPPPPPPDEVTEAPLAPSPRPEEPEAPVPHPTELPPPPPPTNVGKPVALPGYRCDPLPEPRPTHRCKWQATINRWTGCVTGYVCLEPAGKRERPCPPPKKPALDPACRWRPIVDSYGCTTDYDCDPVYVVPELPEEDPLAQRWPCPFVAEPEPKLGCKWAQIIHPVTLCIAHYECETNEPAKCPSEGEAGFVEFPDEVPECRWFPMFDDTGCIFMYGCERRSPCPTEPVKPTDSPACNYAPVVDDVTGCLLEYRCAGPEAGLRLENGVAASYDSEAFAASEQEVGLPCDWREPNACTGHREPMEWGCCRSHHAGRSSWAESGCACDAVQGRCVIRRWTLGTPQWAYCIPKAAFDCYYNFFLSGHQCPLSDRAPASAGPASKPAVIRTSYLRH